MVTRETINGKRERATVERVMDSNIRTQSLKKKCHFGNLHLASVAQKEEEKGHAQWRYSEMEEQVDTQSTQDPSAPFVLDACCSRVLQSATMP